VQNRGWPLDDFIVSGDESESGEGGTNKVRDDYTKQQKLIRPVPVKVLASLIWFFTCGDA
jgi:hypothetical protein